MQRTGLVNTTSPGTPTKIDSNSAYDQILVHPGHTVEYTGRHGVVKFNEEMFGDDDAAAKTALSDHRSVWIELPVPGADDD